jgi:orotidine-5'-phosphate decarboxylase
MQVAVTVILILYEKVITTIAGWGNTNNLMFVTGATQAAELAAIRKIIPDHFLLVPGVGFQGGSLEEVSLHGMNKDVGLLVNASRAIIYAGADENFADEAKAIASQYQAEMKTYINRSIK